MSAKKRLARKNRRPLRQERLAKRLSIGKGSAVALALGLGLTAGAPAEATIVYSGLLNQTTTSGVPLPFLTYGAYNYQFALYQSNSPTSNIGILLGITPNTNAVATYNSVPGYPIADNLGAGATINYTGPWQNVYYPGYPSPGSFAWLGGYYPGPPLYTIGNFLGQQGYVGLSFSPGDVTYYGWAQLFMPADGSYIELIDWAYNDEAGEEIQAGQTPLPSSLVLLATGALALLGFRRVTRKK